MAWLILVIIIIGFFLIKLKSIQATRAKEVLDKFKDKKLLGVSSNANFFGQESKGLAQIRGNGVLLLTENELYFEMWVPKRELNIPLAHILKVETAKSHLKKTKLTPLLKVIFKNDRIKLIFPRKSGHLEELVVG